MTEVFQTSASSEKQITLSEERELLIENPIAQMEAVLGKVLKKVTEESDLNTLEKMMNMVTHKEFLLWVLHHELSMDSTQLFNESVRNMEGALARVTDVFVKHGDTASLERVMRMLTHKEYMLWSLMNE